jgi:ComF family protein
MRDRVGVAVAALGARARDLAAFVLPQRCAGCGRDVDEGIPAPSILCDECLARVPRVSFPLCARCLSLGREAVGCRLHPDFVVWPAWLYDERAELVVHALKFGERTALAAYLGLELARAVPPPRPDGILAVPLHASRRRERGYNQAERLAAALAARLGAPLLEGVLVRSRATRPQTGLGPAARRRNLGAAFRVERPEWIAGRALLVVDDVITTGATLEAALATLAAAGARASATALCWAQ